jgi:glycosyltransferase involved in cell wall biosynthesis
VSSLAISSTTTVYSGSVYLKESIENDLNQTFGDFEFMIVDDCSTDDSWEILSEYSNEDDRIILIKNLENIDSAISSNRAPEITKREYIARLDADDIALLERLQRQIAYLELHPSVALASTVGPYIDEAGIIFMQALYAT